MPSAAAQTAKAIIFDWNSTLLDDVQAMLDCQNILFTQLKRPSITLDFFQAHYDVPFEKLYAKLGLTENEIVEAMGHDQNIFHDHYEPMADKADLRPGTIDILDYAKANGVQSYILSNHLVEPIRAQLRRLAIAPYFTDVLAYADRATQFRDMTKGERLQCYRTTHRLEATPTMIVGDSVEEIEIARAQNLISVAITGGCVSESRLRAAEPDYLIHSLSELKPIMQERGFAS